MSWITWIPLRPLAARGWTGTVGPLATGLLLSVTLVASGCTDGHSRPAGHGDITVGISPSGETVVFNAVGAGRRDLFLLDLKTRQVTQVAATPDYEVDPQFSPDGKSILYAAGQPGDKADHIFRRSIDGKTVHQLTREPFNDASPTFSPDGSLIAFTRDKTYQWGGLAANWGPGVLCVMNADGTGIRQLTADSSLVDDPHFAPDGRTLWFFGDKGLMSVPTDGSAPARPSSTLSGMSPTFAPDGQSIAFADGRFASDYRIFTAKLDGTGRNQIPYPEGQKANPASGGCFRPVFRPDGKRILFFLNSWPTGLNGDSKEGLWEIDLETQATHEIADFSLFDDPLGWKPHRPALPAQP